MVGSYQTITYNRYAVQSATKFKAKIVDIPFCDPESGFSILVASRIEDGKSIVLKGIIPNPVENAYIPIKGTGNKMHGGEHSMLRSKVARLIMKLAAQILSMSC